MKLRLLSVDISMRYPFLCKLFFVCAIIFGLCSQPALAAKKKKKKKSSADKVSIVRRAYEDVTTRNNYYFNANLQWKETIDKMVKARKVDYDSILPLYFHDKANTTAYNSEWDNIIKKMGLVMQMHDYTRWKDNAYLLLGEAHYMKGEHSKALQTFQYISTTMKGRIGQEKLAVTNKERLKMIREMEKQRKKNSKEKQKLIEFKIDLAKKEAEERKEVAEEKADEAKKAAKEKAENKQKILKEKVKLKQKYMDLKERGKKVEPTFTEYYQKNSKYAKQDSIIQKEEEQQVKNAAKTPPSQAPDYSKLRLVALDDTAKLSALDRSSENPLADSLGKKGAKKISDLSLWEKIKHKPSRPDAIVWMAKSLIEKKDDETAHALIQYGQSLRKMTRANKRDLQLIEAYYYLRRENSMLAQQPLSNAIDLTKKKRNKAWYLYLLAQLQEQNDQFPEALLNYKKAGKFTNDFEMAFYSQMSQARLYGKQGLSSNEEQMTAKLKKMVRGGKNKEFADQVYFSLAQLALNRGDTSIAIGHLNKSVAVSTNNMKQKGQSFLLLSKITFEQNDFSSAKNNIDSALGYLPMGFPGTDSIIDVNYSMALVAEYATTIHNQDSLLVLSAMSDAELQDYLALKEAQQEKVERKNKRKKNWSEGDPSSSSPLTGNPVQSQPGSGTGTGLWYFYNQDLLAKGYNDFISKWGNRGLEDGWRRSDKSTFNDIADFAANPEIVPVQENNEGKMPDEDKVSAEEGVANIPRSKEEIAAAKELVAETLYKLGFELRNGLDRPDKSIPYFLRVINNFGGSAVEPQSCYNLYLAYNDLEMTVLAEKYKQQVLDKYPGSQYANNISNPINYTITHEKPRPVSTNEEIYYASTYDLFNSGQYAEVVTRKQYALENYQGGKYIPQFEFLGALSLGHMQQVPELKNALAQIILKYPNTEVQVKAQEYLKYISQSESAQETPVAETVVAVEPVDGLMSFAPQTPYKTGDNNLYFMAYFSQKDNQFEAYKEKLAFVSDENYGKDKYRVSNAYIDNQQSVLLAKRFKTEEEAKRYLELMRQKKKEIFGSSNVELFIISQTNFRTFFDSKDIETYRTFHDYYFK